MTRTSVIGRTALVIVCAIGATSWLNASDYAFPVSSVGKHAFSHALFYSQTHASYSFDGRPDIKYKGNGAGVRVSYGLTEQTSLSLTGGIVFNPKLNSDSTEWAGRSGYSYGVALNQEIFPSTEYYPGVILRLGAQSTVLFLDRQSSAGVSADISQQMRDLQYGGALVGIWRWKQFSPYVGPQLLLSDAKWEDRKAVAPSVSKIDGEAKRKAGIILGSTVRVAQSLDFQVEGRLLNETTINVGLNWSFKN